MKIKVIQVKIGTASYAYNSPKVGDHFEQHLMPTVRRYCDKYGYDYTLITDYPKDRDLLWFNKNTKPSNYDYSVGGKQKASTLVRYLNMFDDEYDAIVTLDNDIYVPENAEPLPVIKGHMAIQDLGKEWGLIRGKYNLPSDIFVNGGVQMVNQEAGKRIYDYFCNVVDNRIEPIAGYHSDQGYMNHFRSLNHDVCHLLDFKWNYMVGCHSEELRFRGNNFIHYAGNAERKMFYSDLERGLLV
jgi:hypothetical protein